MNEKAALIEAEKDEFPIAWMCRQLDIPRSTFYAWRERVDQVTATQARRQWLTRLVRAEFALQKSTAGCRRITVALNQRGVACSVGLVAAIMREEGLAAIQPRAWRRTTVTDPDAVVFDDLLERDFAPGSHTPGSALVGDITYLRTGQGWVYLAIVLDLATRMIVGWQMATHMRASLVVDALEMARLHGHTTGGTIFHSDHGSQYTSQEFQTYCQQYEFRQSMGRTGVCWDNAVAESFFSSLKNEMFHHYAFQDRGRARMQVAEYIETFYNRTRLHSTIGYRTPAQAWAEETTPAAVTVTAA